MRCLLLLGKILYILRTGNRAIEKLQLLAQVVSRHHHEFERLYPDCVKLKPHLLWHILESMHLFKVNLSCFATERKHKISKGTGHFAFKSWTVTMLRRTLGLFMDWLKDPRGCSPFALESPAPIGESGARQVRVDAMKLFCIHKGVAWESKAMHTPTGKINRCDLVAFKRQGQIAVGFCRNLLQHGDGTCLIHLGVLPPVGGACFSTLEAEDCVIPAAAVIGSFPYFHRGDGSIHLVASADCLE